MAIQVLGTGAVGTASFQVDYDNTSKTIAVTVDGTGSFVAVILTVPPTGGTTYTLDCTPFLNQGRTVLAGPGSVLGFPTPVPPSVIPAPVPKGQDRGYVLSMQWAA